MNEDTFFRLKYMGYCMSQLPPNPVITTMEDFIKYAKFQLCRVNNKLMKDEIWDSYTDEEILIEYYATLFSNNKEERERFSNILQGEDPDIHNWFDKQISKNKEDLERLAEKEGDEITFSPNEVLGSD